MLDIAVELSTGESLPLFRNKYALSTRRWRKVSVIMRSRVRERHTHGSMGDLRREPLVYSTMWELDREKMVLSEVLDYGNVESVAWLSQT